MPAKEVLRRYFGYTQFRDGQAQLIEALMQGQDVLGVMPTGAGKSICYQVPALLFSGITLVVSPLISLMHDQVLALVQAGVPAAYLNSSLSPKQMQLVLENAKNEQYKLLYVAPERLLTEDFLRFAKSASISMLAVDEAHCISQWGQDFRPAYLNIPQFIEQLSERPLLSAFTATATKRVREDIASMLHLQNPKTLVTGFNRENLYFEVLQPKDKINALLYLMQNNKEQSGIVYCLTRKTVEQVCDVLKEKGFAAARYHAGLSDEERRTAQEDFLKDTVSVMVATNAFGMGIDKSNVSFVVHYNMPKDMESYYQEAGRAGRDGSSARCTMLYSGQDVRTNQFLIEHTNETEDETSEATRQKREQEYERLRKMTFYATTNDCLRGYILSYFGEDPPTYCGNCSNCDTEFEEIDITVAAQKLLSCVSRMHERFGASMVVAVLRGSKSEKVRAQGFHTLSTYNICDESEEELRVIIRELLHQKVLLQEEGQYPILKLTPLSKDVLSGAKTLKMKQAKAHKEPKRSNILQDIGEHTALYQQLFALRKELASEKNIPAYMLFSNQTLADMCVVLPQTVENFQDVSGVGEKRAEQYGPLFVPVIVAYCEENGVSPPLVLRSKKKRRKDTSPLLLPSEEVLRQISPLEDAVSLSELARHINETLTEQGCSKISAVKIASWLVTSGHLQVVPLDDTHTRKDPTALGQKEGITTEEVHARGQTYQMNFYSQYMQHFIIASLPEIFLETRK